MDSVAATAPGKPRFTGGTPVSAAPIAAQPKPRFSGGTPAPVSKADPVDTAPKFDDVMAFTGKRHDPLLSLTTNTSDAIPTIAGAPVDLARTAINAATQPNPMVTNIPYIGPILAATQGLNQLAGNLINGQPAPGEAQKPLIPELKPGVGSSDWFRGLLTATGIPTTQTVAATNAVERAMAATGQGVGLTLTPELALAGLVKAGIITSAKAAEVLGEIVGPAKSTGGIAANAAIGGAATGVGEAASEGVPDEWKPIVNVLAGLGTAGVAVGVGVGGKAAWNAAKKGTAEALRPLTPGGQEKAAAETIRAGMEKAGVGEGQVLEDLAAPQLVPGSELTSPQRAEGLSELERVVRTKNPQAFNDRAAEQNVARKGMVEGMQPTGAPETVVAAVRKHVDRIEQEGTAAHEQATQVARQAAEAPGPGAHPEEAGQTLRAKLEESRAAAKTQESALWEAINPNHDLTLPVASTKARVGQLTRELPASAKPPGGEEAAIFKVVQSYDNIIPLDELTALKSRLNTAMREERFANGDSPALRRMTLLNDAVFRDLDAAVAHNADAIAPRVQALDNAGALGNVTRDSPESMPAVPRAAAAAPDTVLPPVPRSGAPEAPQPAAARAEAPARQLEPAYATSPVDRGVAPARAPASRMPLGAAPERAAAPSRPADAQSPARPAEAPAARPAPSANDQRLAGMWRGTAERMRKAPLSVGETQAQRNATIAMLEGKVDALVGKVVDTEAQTSVEGTAKAPQRARTAAPAPRTAPSAPKAAPSRSEPAAAPETTSKPVVEEKRAATVAPVNPDEPDLGKQFKAQIVEAGQPDDVASASAAVAASTYETMAKTMGMSVKEFTDTFGLPEIRAGGPNGEATTLEQSARPLTETPAFKKWFGSSKIVDAEGRPRRVYHGTGRDFEAFDIAKSGTGSGTPAEKAIFVSTDPATASHYADVQGVSDTADHGGAVYPLYAKAENPMVSDLKYYNSKKFAEEIARAKRRGHDAVMFPNVTYAGEKGAMAVFDPTQLKSAFNRGSFDPNDPRILFQPAWHGTPHQFDKFDSKKIGTGEGAQAYGYGLYFAGKKEVAAWYREKLASNPIDKIDSIIGHLIRNPRDHLVTHIDAQLAGHGINITPEERALMVRAIRGGKKGLFGSINYSADATVALSQLDTLLSAKKGRLFKVDVPDDTELMNWDAPLSKQPKEVIEKLRTIPGVSEMFAKLDAEDRALLKDLGEEVSPDVPLHDGNLPAMSGEGFYQRLGAMLTGERDRLLLDRGKSQDVAASDALREAGVPGHRYLDQASRPNQGQVDMYRQQLAKLKERNASEAAIRETERNLVEAEKGISHNYVIYDDSRINVTDFEQGRPSGAPPRAQITFNLDGKRIISLFDNADASSSLHEFGHDFLHTYKAMAEHPKAPDQLRKDWTTVKDWWSSNAEAVAADSPSDVTADDVRAVLTNGSTGDAVKDAAINVGLHEQWARGFEAYLREGKAPTPGLAKVFQQFRDWLTSIYRRADELNIKLSPEMRGVFDRMIAGTDHISDVPKMVEPSFTPAARERLRTASAATKARAQTFDNSLLKPMRKRASADGPYNMTDSSVPKRLFAPGPKSAESIRTYRKAVGDPEALEALQDYAVDSLNRAAMREDGTLDPKRLDRWRKAHRDALTAFPELDKQFTDAEAASLAMGKVAKARDAKLREAQLGVVGRVMKLDDPQSVVREVGSIFGRKNAVEEMRRLRMAIGDDAEGREGLRKAVVEHILTKYVGNTEVGTSGETGLKSDQLQTFLKNNHPTLEKAGFTEAEIKQFEALAEDLQRASRSTTAAKIPGQSNTMQDWLSVFAHQVIKHKVTGAVLGTLGLTGNPFLIGGGILFTIMRQRGLSKIDDILRDAMLNPKRLRLLLMKTGPTQKQKIAEELARQYRTPWLPKVGRATLETAALNADEDR